MNKPNKKKLEKEITVEEFLNFAYKHLDCIVEFRNQNLRIFNDDSFTHIKLRKAQGKISTEIIPDKILPTMIISIMHGKVEIAQSVFSYENNFKVIYTEHEAEINGQIYHRYLFELMDKPKGESSDIICQFEMSHAMDDHKESEVSHL